MDSFLRLVRASPHASPPPSASALQKATLRATAIGGLLAPGGAAGGCAKTRDTASKKSCLTADDATPAQSAAVGAVLARDPVPREELRALCWRGCPPARRYDVWGVLTGHLQPMRSRRAAVLGRKRAEYAGYVERLDGATGDACVGGEWEGMTRKQIRKDVPRMSAGVAYLTRARVMRSLERILYIWAMRHPACGYVQGMNDLIIPFISVVLAHRFCATRTVAELHTLSPEVLDALFAPDALSEEEWTHTVEADTYWMTAYFLGAVQENYTYNQKGLYSMVEKMEGVVRAVDAKLHTHLREVLQVDFRQFAFRWMNCMLLRELNVTQSLRLWDVYLADEEKDWSTTHVYICTALLLQWSPVLRGENDYGVVIRFLQNLPTEEIVDFDALISQGVMMQKLYNNTPSRLMLPQQ